MDLSQVKRAVTLFMVLLVAFLAASFLSHTVISVLSLSGAIAFVAGLLLYAVFFFGALSLFERLLGIRIFGFDTG